VEEKLRRAWRILAIAVFLLNVVFWAYPRLGFLGVLRRGGIGPAPAVLDEPSVTATPVERIFIRNSPCEEHTIELPQHLGAPFGGQKISFRGGDMCCGAEVGERLSIIAGELSYEIFEVIEVLPEGIWVEPLGEIKLHVLPPEVPLEPQKSAALGPYLAQSGFFYPPSQKTSGVSPWMNVSLLLRWISLRRRRVQSETEYRPESSGRESTLYPSLTPRSRVR